LDAAPPLLVRPERVAARDRTARPARAAAEGSRGRDLLPDAAETSLQTQWLIDKEVRRFVDDAHAEATRFLAVTVSLGP
jgi:hypothetical protein